VVGGDEGILDVQGALSGQDVEAASQSFEGAFEDGLIPGAPDIREALTRPTSRTRRQRGVLIRRTPGWLERIPPAERGP
jgi:hypothetical protein